MAALVALLSFMVLSPEAFADVVPYGVGKARERLTSTNSWERTDQFCAGKSPDAACAIPGNPFEGGGSGRCARTVTSEFIDLVCRLDAEIKVDRRMPDGRYLADPSFCSDVASGRLSAQALEPRRLTCAKPAQIADRFCEGKKAGEACDAVLLEGGTGRSFPGHCRDETESIGFYYQGNRSASRDVLLCRPARRAPAAVMTSVGWFEKFLQVFQ